MKNLAKRFLTDEERTAVESSVQDVEKITSGEVVPMIVSSSYHYPVSNIIGAVIFALPLSLFLTILMGGWLWMGTNNMWLFLVVFSVLFFVFHEVCKRCLGIKRFLISRKEINEEVEEAAITSFFKHGLYKTRDETGVLIFISVFEHKVCVLADKGINEKVDEGQWDDVVKVIVDGIKQNKQAEAICNAVKMVGDKLHKHFPVKSDDTNELKNIIVEE